MGKHYVMEDSDSNIANVLNIQCNINYIALFLHCRLYVS